MKKFVLKSLALGSLTSVTHCFEAQRYSHFTVKNNFEKVTRQEIFRELGVDRYLHATVKTIQPFRQRAQFSMNGYGPVNNGKKPFLLFSNM